MRIFLAGASGAVGKRLLPALVTKSHQVVGMVYSPQKADWVRSMGAEPVVANGLDADAIRQAVARTRPEIIINQMTALSTDFNPRRFDQIFATTNKLRTEGNDNLLAAAKASSVRRFIAQSYAGWP
jgi:nucleoside-diphosphate-sugar epimerase